MDKFFEVLNAVDAFVWGPFFLIPLLLGTGLWLTIRLTGIQFRKLGPALHLALLKRDEGAGESVEGKQPLDDTIEGDISHYQALTTALAATVGVGNIAGVATAIHIGGPGAVFWMWVTGLVGMASKYSEAFLAVRFRTKDAKGEMSGGPQYYLEHVTKVKWLGRTLAIAFAIFAIIASFGIGNLTQANSVATQLEACLLYTSDAADE